MKSYISVVLEFGRAVIGRSAKSRERSQALRERSRALQSTARAMSGAIRPPIRGGDDRRLGTTARDRILAFLRARPDEAWCAECVAGKLGLARARVANVFLAAEGVPGFRRQDVQCAGCGRRRLGLGYRQSVSVGSVDAVGGGGDSPM